MKWLWVPRSAFEAVCAERDRVIAQNEKLLAHVQRTDRVEHGLSELPRQPRAEIQPIPRELLEFFRGFENKSLGRAQRNEALRRHAQGQSWEQITKDAMPQPEESDGQPA